MDRQHNPNYPPHRSPPSYSPFSQPPPSQIAPQQPSFDPFQRADARRDPFMPASLANRRESLGNSRNGLDVLQPPLQRPHSPFRPTPSSSYHSEQRRNSLDGRFPTGAGEMGQNTASSQQQGPSLLGRHMPPPASSPRDSPSQPYSSSSMRAPYSNSASRPRDTNPRSTGSMSIQSIMGSDSGPTTNQASWSSATGRSPPSTSYGQPPSPPDRRFNGKRDSDSEPAPHTPIKRSDGPLYAPHERPLASIQSSSTSTAHQQHSEREHQGFSRLLQPFNPVPAESSAGPPRPYSQPSGLESQLSGAAPQPYDHRTSQGSRESYIGGTFEKAVRERSFSELEKKPHSPIEHLARPQVEPFSPVRTSSNPTYAPYHARSADPRDSVPNGGNIGGSRRDQEQRRLSSDRTATSPGLHHSSLPPQYGPLNGSSEPNSYGNGQRQTDDQTRPVQRPADSSGPRIPPIDSQLRKSIEETSRQSFSRFPSDLSRRPDRSSPLPQAVQGAQSQPAGLGRDPGIKSEFGKMFAGLGSGVGSTPQPLPHSNGAGTPRRSPDETPAESERPGRRGGLPTRGPGSRGGRRGKRAIPEDGRLESDDGDGRATPGTSTRGKRTRYLQNPTGHHHHYHPPGIHHHHHTRKLDDGLSFPPNRRGSGTPYSSFKFPTPASTGQSNVTPHHHHHHLHHHHHPPPKSTPDVRMKPPRINVSSASVLRSVAHLPRNHLGSQLYAPKLSIAPAAASTIDSPASHKTYNEPNEFPRFAPTQANGLFVIRVPRYFLSHTERQRICKARYLWGTEVYTDDSDPIAAAIHSGWIRGAWADDVDVALLLSLPSANSAVPRSKDGPVPAEDQPSTATLTEPPADAPPVPPPNRDLHLTLLILPPLEQYAGSIRFGIKSRKWGDNHDGMSFKIEKVEWVDEGPGSRNEERTVEAKRKRVGDGITSARHSKTILQSMIADTTKAPSHNNESKR